MRIFYLLGLAVCLTFGEPAFAVKRALLIGIGDYPNVTKLAGPQDDVSNISSLLTSSMGFRAQDIKSLVDEQASRKNILETLENWIVNGTAPGDEVLFYYSGHGFQTNDLNGDEKDHKDEAIAPYDAKIEGKQVVNMITDDEMEKVFSKIEDRAVTMIIDSCHSGTLTRGLVKASDQQYEKTINEFNQLATGLPTKSVVQSHRDEKSFIESTPNRVVWTAVSAWQKALVDFEKKNGSVFTNQFITGVKDKKADANQNGVVSRAELLAFIRDQSTQFCERNINNCRTGLTPTLEVSKDLLVADAADISNSLGTGASNSVSAVEYLAETLPAAATNLIQLKTFPESNKFKLGSWVGFEVTSQKDGFLVLLDIDSEGQIAQIFPNRFTDKTNLTGRITAGQTMRIPGDIEDGDYKFQAQAPKGKGTLIAILTDDRVLPEDISKNKDLVVLGDSKTYVQNLVESLNSVWTQDEVNRAVQWHSAQLDYQIY